jgi:hypothetical protein
MDEVEVRYFDTRSIICKNRMLKSEIYTDLLSGTKNAVSTTELFEMVIGGGMERGGKRKDHGFLKIQRFVRRN